MTCENMQRNETVDICMITDSDYVMPTCVAIQSLILSKSKESYYRIYIIASDLSQQAEGQFKTLATDSAEIHIIQESAEKSFVGFHLYDDKETCVASRAALLKFNIAELLPHLDKVLYLDSDIIVKESLETLFSENIDGYYTAAVHESGCMYYNIAYAHRVACYFCSGVMLMNLKKLRQEAMAEKLLHTARELTDSFLLDQDVFNVVFDGQWKQLPIRYDFLSVNLYRAYKYWQIEEVNLRYGTNYRNKKQLFADAAIIHYGSKDKPWKDPDGACASEWLEVYLKTPIEHTLLQLPPREEEFGVSVIMPCYNVENYVDQTMRSLLDQTFQDFEVICLDDGSTDATLAILREYEARYPNIRVFTNSNHGQGWERNYGIQLARGKYIYFMDSDDLLRPNCLSRIYTCAEVNQLDLLFFEASSFFESADLESRFPQYKTAYDRQEAFPAVYSGEELYIRFREKGGLIVQPCLQLSRKRFLEENNILFPELPMLEDNLFVFNELRYAHRVKCIPDVLYDRRIREGSIMTAARKADRVQALSVVVGTMMQNLTDYKEGTPMFCAVAAHIKLYLEMLRNAYYEMVDTGATGAAMESAQNAVIGFSLFSDFDRKLCTEQAKNKCQKPAFNRGYQKGINEVENSKTFLVGRVITWLPKQIVAFVRTAQKSGLGTALKKAGHKLALLPARAAEAFRK